MKEILRRFPDEEACFDFLDRARWEGKPTCIYCHSFRVSPRKGKRRHCYACNRNFSITAKTLFHHTKLPIRTWMLALSIFLSARKSISSRQLARMLGINKDTAWYVTMRIRAAMAIENDLLQSLARQESDPPEAPDQQTPRFMRFKGKARGAILFLLLRGKILTKPIEEVFGPRFNSDLSLLGIGATRFIQASVEDEYNLPDSPYRPYVLDQPQANLIEGTFDGTGLFQKSGLMFRAIIGQFHHVSARFFRAYLEEFTHRDLARQSKDSFLRLSRAMLLTGGC